MRSFHLFIWLLLLLTSIGWAQPADSDALGIQEAVTRHFRAESGTYKTAGVVRSGPWVMVDFRPPDYETPVLLQKVNGDWKVVKKIGGAYTSDELESYGVSPEESKKLMYK
jgi:hypothetical protein